jgi:hypothetical protein
MAGDGGNRAQQVLEVVCMMNPELDHGSTRALVGEPAPGVGGELETPLVGEIGLGQ